MTHPTAPLPNQPWDSEGPVFAEPWQADAFALTVGLHEAGVFTWLEWAETLGAEIKRAQADGDADMGGTYYRHWLRALERLLDDKNVMPADVAADRKEAWRRAYLSTPHGQPVTLAAAD